MTLAEAAEKLGLKSTSTLRMQIARGALQAELYPHGPDGLVGRMAAKTRCVRE